MSIMTAGAAPADRAPFRTVDPAAVVARTRPRTTISEAVSQTLIMAWRALKKMRRNPEQFFDVTLQPLLFTAMFAYIFGGAIAGSVHSYLPLLIPGIGAQGGDVEATVNAGRTAAGTGMLINSSRAIIYAGNGDDYGQAAAKARMSVSMVASAGRSRRLAVRRA